jgi:DNA-binding response OmpR family regulator
MSVIEDVKTILGNSSSKKPVTVTTHHKKIIIVEDDAILLEMYHDKFVHSGFDVITATNGKEGLQKTLELKPNIILLDLMMPVMSGNQMLKKLREFPQFKKIPVIVLTNAGQVDNIRETTRYDDACEFLIKSNVTVDEVVQKVEFWLNAFFTG